jgi:hypothetical protein
MSQKSDLSSFILSVFDEFVGVDYNAEGNRTFREYIDPDSILSCLWTRNFTGRAWPRATLTLQASSGRGARSI